MGIPALLFQQTPRLCFLKRITAFKFFCWLQSESSQAAHVTQEMTDV